MDRIATFKSFISRSPTDPFPRYGLAMEYKGSGRLGDAWAAFEDLMWSLVNSAEFTTRR